MEILDLEALLPGALEPLAQYMPLEAAIAVSVIMSIIKRFAVWVHDIVAERLTVVLSFLVVAGMYAYSEGWVPYLNHIAEIGLGGALVWISSSKLGYGFYKWLKQHGIVPETTDDDVAKERARTARTEPERDPEREDSDERREPEEAIDEPERAPARPGAGADVADVAALPDRDSPAGGGAPAHRGGTGGPGSADRFGYRDPQ